MDNIEKTSSGGFIQFEEGYIFKSNKSITSIPDIALTEFVANAWDAGASTVNITIPDEEGDIISVEDDGTGMTDEEFHQRWMTLNYDRQKRQGKEVTFPEDATGYKRMAYGRNGVGRHGMLCFANYYTIETWKAGLLNKYEISISEGSEPFKIEKHERLPKEGHGTKLSAYVHRHLPNADEMTDIISARFLYDPRFCVLINGRKVALQNHKGLYTHKNIVLKNGIKLEMTIIDSTKTAMKSQQHGIAFWIGGRLVGKPSWNSDGFQFLDARVRVAKRYTIIVVTDDLIDYVLPDWSGFIDSSLVKTVYTELKKEVDAFINSIMAEQVSDLKRDIILDSRHSLETLSTAGKRDVSKFIDNVTERNPVISPDFLKTAVDAIITIEKAKKGEQLLSQLSQMSAKDIDKLSDLLRDWDIDDVVAVINEIDRRISVVGAIARIYDDEATDELHTLHPIVLNARWLFGSEFDSPMFVSNSALTTVIRKLFKESDYDLDEISNPRKRPDIVCLKTISLKAVCTDRVDNDANGVMKPDQVLIIELKRGGFSIGPEEVSQTEHYVRQIKKSSILHKAAEITAFVVGATIGDVDCNKVSDSGRIHVVTYGQLVETANKKLFRLREQLQKHYDEIGDKSLVEKTLADIKQVDMDEIIKKNTTTGK